MSEGSGVAAQSVLEQLQATPLWRDTPRETLERVAARMEPRTFVDGEILITQGKPGTALHCITDGQVELRIRVDDEAETLATLSDGECVGEMSLLTGDPASLDVVAVGEVETLALSASDFSAVVATDAELLKRFVRIIARRLQHADVAVGVARGKEQDLTDLLGDAEAADAELVGKSGEIRRVQKAIEALGPGTRPVLVRGEEGTGRARVAVLLHRASERTDEPVIGVECALIAETDWGDKLFGPLGGSFTADRPVCYLDLADGGTLVLKHLERLPEAVQARLAEFLEDEDDPRDVRVVATCPEADETDGGRVVPHLLMRFGDRVVAMPPLRERKRDIPLLAEHYRAKHAARLGKEVGSFSEGALTRLVSYDYHIGNDRELEAGVERAVILTDRKVIESEAVFLGPPPTALPGGVNLLAFKGLDMRKVARVLPKALRWATALFFAFILYQAFFGPSHGDGNLATVLVWSLWWPALVLSFFFAGRAWCSVCPMGLTAAAGDYVHKATPRIPAWLKNHDVAIAMGGLFLIVFLEEAVGMRHSPLATGLLLVAIFAGAALTGWLFPRRTWCRHICPLGGMAGVCSTSGLLELRPTFDICAAKCKGHDCYKGDGKVAGCPLFNHVMFVDSNVHCTLCMNCVQACPNESPQLNLRLPGREIWSGAVARPGFGQFVLMLMGLLVGMTALQWFEFTGSDLWRTHHLLLVTVALVVGAAVPLVVGWIAARAAEERGPVDLERFWSRVAALTPLVLAGFVAYHLVYIPGLEWMQASMTQGGGDAEPWLRVSILSVARFVVLTGGLVITGVLLWRAGRRLRADDETERLPRRREGLWWLTSLAYWALLLALMIGAQASR